MDFWSNPLFQNRQLTAIDSIHLSFFRFIGLTEQFDQTIELYNDLYGTSLKKLRTNTRASDINSNVKFNEDQLKFFCHKNQKEIHLYNNAVIRFHQSARLTLPVKTDQRYASSMRVRDDGIIQGWAIDYAETKPAMLQIESASKSVEIVACIKRNDLLNAQIHLSGYCGFSESLPAIRKALGAGPLNIRFKKGPMIGHVSE